MYLSKLDIYKDNYTARKYGRNFVTATMSS